ncbi:ankyrin repeat and protein kinase domain-containing protein 1-like [Littorina saxatilis]|uniref:SOCS box domain-containing protein n=1 Tax=Littorina saxatilis TaxID=31220 RepID=A0AAN9ANU1_9CAEN
MEEQAHGDREGEGAAATDKNCEALYTAVTADDLATLQQLLAEGTNADMFYDNDQSILHIACGKGRTECVKLLLDAGAMPDIHDKWGQTPLHYCICVQYLDTAMVLFDHLGEKASDIVNNQDSSGKSPLHSAAESGSMEAIELLLKYGADVNVRNFDGVTPLMVLAESYGRSNTIQAMQTLLAAGALIDIADYRSRRSALQRAAVAKNMSAVELLISTGAEVDSLDITRRTPLTNLMWDHVRNKQGTCHIDSDVMTIIVLLTQAGANLDLAVCEYSNPLVTAAFLQAAQLLSFFLDQGARPNVTFRSGVTPLLIATSKKDMECVKVLLKHNCCMTTKGKVYRKRLGMEYTFDPIEMALDDGSYHLVKLFLSAGYPATSFSSQLRERIKTDSAESNSMLSKELQQWLLSRISHPASLWELAVFSIRHILGQCLHKVVPVLPLPSKVKDSILLTHLLT